MCRDTEKHPHAPKNIVSLRYGPQVERFPTMLVSGGELGMERRGAEQESRKRHSKIIKLTPLVFNSVINLPVLISVLSL